MRTNSFIAEDIDGVWGEAGRMQEKGVYMLKHHHAFHHVGWGNLSVRELTRLGGFEADDKRLSGESIDISWSIIWVLILARDCHRVSPESIQTNTLQPVMSSCVGAKWRERRHSSSHL